MTRTKFITGLLGILGIAKAQDWKECEREKTNPALCASVPGSMAVKFLPAKNNQCPVCGEMAKPFKPSRDLIGYKYKECTPAITDSSSVCADPIYSPETKSPNLTRCARCNAAFFQDPEPSEEKK